MSTRQPMPEHLRRHLQTTGVLPVGTSRDARASACRACGAWLLVGLDADRCALHVRVDTDPVDEVGELLALAAGRSTYDLTYSAGRFELEHRDPWQIRAGHRNWPVHVEHRCGQPLPAAAPTALTEADVLSTAPVSSQPNF